MIRILLLPVALFFAPPASGQLTWSPPSTNSMENVSSMLADLRVELDVPGLAAALVQGTNITAAGAAGVRRHGHDSPVLLTDKFHIGSCTKSMTALLALLLAREGYIDLQASPAEMLPDWKLPPAASEMTLTLLLQNRAGLSGKPSRRTWGNAWERLELAPPEQREKFLQEFLAEPLEAAPGTKYIYSNQGFALAGLMIEKAMRKPWEVLVRERVLQPLGLSSAGFGAPASGIKVDQPWGHTRGKVTIKPSKPGDNPPAIAPGGAVHCSILDQARYVAFHLQAVRGEVPELKNYRDVLYTPPDGQKYAFGWLVTDSRWGKGKALNHTGSNTMFYTVFWVVPDENLAVAVSLNIGEDEALKKCERVADALVKRFRVEEPGQ